LVVQNRPVYTEADLEGPSRFRPPPFGEDDSIDVQNPKITDTKIY